MANGLLYQDQPYQTGFQRFLSNFAKSRPRGVLSDALAEARRREQQRILDESRGGPYQVPQGNSYQIPESTQAALDIARAEEERALEQASQQGLLMDSSSNILSGNLAQPVAQNQQQTLPPQSDGLMEIMVNPRRLDEKQFMQPRAQGILGTLGDLFGVNQPDFRDRLVMGLGALTFDPSNPLTQQASANIAARRQAEQADLERKARLQIAQEQMRSAEGIAQRELEAELATPSDSFLSEAREWESNRYVAMASEQALERALSIVDDPTRKTSGFISNAFRDIPVLGQWLTSIEGSRWADAATAQQLVEQVLSENLREILGGQFAALEGFRYLERGYNPYLSKEENSTRINLLLNSIRQVRMAKDRLYSQGTYSEEAFAREVQRINDSLYEQRDDGSVIARDTGEVISSLGWNDNTFLFKDALLAKNFTEEDWNNLSLEGKQATVNFLTNQTYNNAQSLYR